MRLRSNGTTTARDSGPLAIALNAASDLIESTEPWLGSAVKSAEKSAARGLLEGAHLVEGRRLHVELVSAARVPEELIRSRYWSATNGLAISAV